MARECIPGCDSGDCTCNLDDQCVVHALLAHGDDPRSLCYGSGLSPAIAPQWNRRTAEARCPVCGGWVGVMSVEFSWPAEQTRAQQSAMRNPEAQRG